MKNPRYAVITMIILASVFYLGFSKPEKAADCMINIDLNKVKKEISKGLFGFNLEWIEDGNFVWDSKNNGFNSIFLSGITGLKPTIFRFPGGVFSDFYHWRDGVGNQVTRPKRQSSPFDSRIFDNSFGTDEFLVVCGRLGADPLITVNVGTSTSEEAADWVHYCNILGKIKRVGLWELGNELYINSDEGSRSISVSPGAYVGKVKEFALAMKKADPSIRIAAIGGANTGLYNINQYPGWDEAVLRTAGQNIDYLSVHNAYYPAVVNSNTYTMQEVYKSLFGANSLIEENIKVLNKEIADFAPLYKDKIKIAITEWGPLFAWSANSPYRDETRSLGSALYVALALKTFITSDNVEIANFFKLSGSDFMAFIQGGKKYPPYYAFQMFSSDFGDILLETNCQSPKYSTEKRVGIIGPLKDIPLLEAIASKDAQGNLYLIVINKDLEKGHNCIITFNNDVFNVSGVSLILTGKDVSSKEAILEKKEVSGKGQFNFFVPAHSIAKFKLQITK